MAPSLPGWLQGIAMNVPGVLLGLFGMEEPQVLAIGTELLAWLSVSGIFVAVALVYTGGLQGTGDTKGPLYISIVSQIVLPLGLCALLQAVRGLTPSDIWLVILLGHIARCTLTVWRFRLGGWREITLRVAPRG